MVRQIYRLFRGDTFSFRRRIGGKIVDVRGVRIFRPEPRVWFALSDPIHGYNAIAQVQMIAR